MLTRRRRVANSTPSRDFQQDMLEPDDEHFELSTRCDGELTPSSSQQNDSRDAEDGRGGDSKSVSSASPPETLYRVAMQVILPFLAAGIGMVSAGLILDTVQHWPVFITVNELFVLVPALLGLKGNLEMTLASRLSTHAHLHGNAESKKWTSVVVANLALVQCQAIGVALLASTFAILSGYIFGTFESANVELAHGLLLIAASIVTASFAAFGLGLVMAIVVKIAANNDVNPDNIATPIAASLGDLITLALLSFVSSNLFDDKYQSNSVLYLLIFTFVAIVWPSCTYLAFDDERTRPVLMSGWPPVIIAMFISSLGGVILNHALSKFSGIAVYQPVMNGVGGNLVAVQASRLSTEFHKLHHTSRKDSLKSTEYSDTRRTDCDDIDSNSALLANDACCEEDLIAVKDSVKLKPDSGLRMLTSFSPTLLCWPLPSCVSHKYDELDSEHADHWKVARLFLVVAIPGQLLFAYLIALIQAGHTSPTLVFFVVYIFAAGVQVYILLTLAPLTIQCLWERGIDPDNSAIPYLTAVGDLLGSLLLYLAFEFLFLIGDRDLDVGD